MIKSYFLFFLLGTSILVSSQKLTVLTGSQAYCEGVLGEAHLFLIKYSYEGMRIGEYSREQDYIDAETDRLNKIKAGKGDVWKEKWNSSKLNKFQPTLEKYCRSLLSKSNVRIGRDIEEAEYIMLINIHAYEKEYIRGKDVISCSFNIEIIDAETEKSIVKTAIAKCSERPNSSVGISVYPGIPMPSPWNKYGIISRLNGVYAKAGKLIGEFLFNKIGRIDSTIFKPNLMVKYNLGSLIDYKTSSFQIAVEYVFLPRFSTQFEIGYITQYAFLPTMLPNDIEKRETLEYSGLRFRNEYRLYPLKRNEYHLYVALDFLYKKYTVLETQMYDAWGVVEVLPLESNNETFAGHIKLGFQYYIKKKIVIDAFLGLGQRYNYETIVFPENINPEHDNEYYYDSLSNKLFVSAVLGVKIGYILF